MNNIKLFINKTSTLVYNNLTPVIEKEIIIDELELDILSSEDLAPLIVKQNFDIDNPNVKVGDYTLNLRLPATAKNNKIFNHLNIIKNANGFYNQERYPARIEVNSLNIITGRLYILSASKEEYQCAIIGDNISWSDLLKDKLLTDIPFDNLIYAGTCGPSRAPQPVPIINGVDLRDVITSEEGDYECYAPLIAYGNFYNDDVYTIKGRCQENTNNVKIDKQWYSYAENLVEGMEVLCVNIRPGAFFNRFIPSATQGEGILEFLHLDEQNTVLAGIGNNTEVELKIYFKHPERDVPISDNSGVDVTNFLISYPFGQGSLRARRPQGLSWNEFYLTPYVKSTLKNIFNTINYSIGGTFFNDPLTDNLIIPFTKETPTFKRDTNSDIYDGIWGNTMAGKIFQYNAVNQSLDNNSCLFFTSYKNTTQIYGTYKTIFGIMTERQCITPFSEQSYTQSVVTGPLNSNFSVNYFVFPSTLYNEFYNPFQYSGSVGSPLIGANNGSPQRVNKDLSESYLNNGLPLVYWDSYRVYKNVRTKIKVSFTFGQQSNIFPQPPLFTNQISYNILQKFVVFLYKTKEAIVDTGFNDPYIQDYFETGTLPVIDDNLLAYEIFNALPPVFNTPVFADDIFSNIDIDMEYDDKLYVLMAFPSEVGSNSNSLTNNLYRHVAIKNLNIEWRPYYELPFPAGVNTPGVYNETAYTNPAHFLPDEYTQLDFVLQIIKLFNLQVQFDLKTKNIVFNYYKDHFYGADTAYDWTEKANLDNATITPTDFSKKYTFKYTEDDDFYVNPLKYDLTYQSKSRYYYNESVIESDFSATANRIIKFWVNGFSLPIPALGSIDDYKTPLKDSEINTDHNIRIMKVLGFTEILLPQVNANQNYNYYKKYKYLSRGLFVDDQELRKGAGPGLPLAYFDFDDVNFNVLLNDNIVNGQFINKLNLNFNNNGIFSEYWQKNIQFIEKTIRVKLPVQLTTLDVATINPRRPIKINNDIFYIQSIDGFNPATEKVVNVNLIKKL